MIHRGRHIHWPPLSPHTPGEEEQLQQNQTLIVKHNSLHTFEFILLLAG